MFFGGEVTIVQLPLLPIVPCTPDLLFQMGLLLGSYTLGDTEFG